MVKLNRKKLSNNIFGSNTHSKIKYKFNKNYSIMYHVLYKEIKIYDNNYNQYGTMSENGYKKPIGVFEAYLINLFLLTRKYRYARN